jgi:acetyltransferase-like isoleucine patch superfamily enzyme
LEAFYVEHFLRPQFDSLGKGYSIVRPWHVQVFGPRIRLGAYANVIASADAKVRFSVWGERDQGRIDIGRYCLVCPGVRIGSGAGISIGDSCMLAYGAYVTDGDWHDKYNRVTIGKTLPVRIQDNVWIGDRATVCKGVTIGKNSIIGAGAVITSDVPPNAVAAGNPARVVEYLDPHAPMKTRAEWYADPEGLFAMIDRERRNLLRGNTFLHWLRHLLFPGKGE